MTKSEETELLIRLDGKVTDMHKVIFGNGRPGLYDEHQILKVQHEECKKRNDKSIKVYVTIATILSPTILKLIEVISR